METKDIALLAVTLIILGEVTYLLAKLPKTSIKAKDRAILTDTSVLMDGRITGIAATGFIGGTLVVPRSVIGELQFLADNADAEKRARARFGLDVVNQLQTMDSVEVEILQDGSKAEEGVDNRLLSLAKRHGAVICTLDYNLNKVAVVEGIKVLNINELAQSLRMSHLPGDRMSLQLTQKGQDSHQGVGYLPDGTMVVVEQSSSMIGQMVVVEVTRSLQTAAGKMMFAKRVDVKPREQAPKKPTQQVAQKAKSAGRSPAQVEKPAQQKTESVKQPAKVYHAHRRHQKPQVEKPVADTKPKPQTRRRANDREASLIALVNSQSDE